MEDVSMLVTNEETKSKKYVGYYHFYSVKVDLSTSKQAHPNIEKIMVDFLGALNNQAKCVSGFRKDQFLLVGQINHKVRNKEEVMSTLVKIMDSIKGKLEHIKIQYELELGFTQYEHKPV